MIKKARELAAEVKERTVAAARSVAEAVDAFFRRAGKQTPMEEGTLTKEQEQARSPALSVEERLAQRPAGLDKKLAAQESLEDRVAGFEKRMESQIKSQQEQQEKNSRSRRRLSVPLSEAEITGSSDRARRVHDGR